MSRVLTNALRGVAMALLFAGCGATGGASPGSPAAAGPSGGSGGGSTGASPGSAVVIDSCSILSDEEITAATGNPVVARTASTLTQVFSSVCDIEVDGGPFLTVGILPTGGRTMYEVSFEPLIGSEVLDEAVEGLGDKAGRANGEVMVLTGDLLFDIQVQGSRDRDAIARYLAEVILAKLPCLASGCPGLTPPPAPSILPVIDTCSLLSAQEVEQAVGYPAAAPAPTAGGCQWVIEGDSTVPGRFAIDLAIFEPGGRERFDFVTSGLEQIPAVGDGAAKLGGNTDGTFYAVTGDRMLTVRYALPLDVVDPDPLVVPLIEIALSRL